MSWKTELRLVDLDDHTQVFKLLPAESALGMQLTTAFQLVPEQSTAAIIVHHPEAKYYTVRELTPPGTPPGARSEERGASEQVA